MMNVKYYHDFIGADDIINRFEILCESATVPKQIEASNTPFCLEYLEVKKLEPVQGAQATINLISESNFQFVDLHTDDMQKYMIKFYRDNDLYWIGYLDSELYNENLTDSPPYHVEFSAADFNIMERLKFRDENEKPYVDIVTLLTILKRCFDKLGLPYQKLYIGCSTGPEGIAMTVSETILHKLYIQSVNFYDEDNEAMTCREVVESILQPFGLMMVQRDACVYIYDLNTIKSGGVMKCYNFNTLAYIGDTAVNTQLGDIGVVGTMSTTASLGFEEMVNNVTITSSLYADKSVVKGEATEKNLSESISIVETEVLKKELFAKCGEIEKVGSQNFVVYLDKDSENTIIGASSPYDPFRGDYSKTLYRIKSTMPIVSTDSRKNNILLKMNCYVSSSDNPFTAEFKGESDAVLCQIAGNLYTVDGNGTPLYYYRNLLGKPQWKSCSPDFSKGSLRLLFCSQVVKGSNIYNTQLTNSNIYDTTKAFESVKPKDYGKGLIIPIDSNIYGQIVFEIIGAMVSKWMPLDHSDDLFFPNGGGNVKDIIYNDIDIKIVDENKEDIPTDDYEFKSYINKKVASDYDGVTLKCISANEDKLPVGKANILKKVKDHYELQLSYTRAGQTDILERLLMCTIHSNFTTKNKVISVDVKMTDNPALRYVTYNNVIQSNCMYVTGATLDFHNAVTTIKAVEFSADTDKLSEIPYE